MPLADYLFPTHATEMFERTLGNANVPAINTAEISSSAVATASNLSAGVSTLYTLGKSISATYGFGLMLASATDAVWSKNTYSRCLFGVGCGIGYSPK